jgi:hypothetical protein
MTSTTDIQNPVSKSCLHLIVTAHGLWQPAHHMDYWRDTFLEHIDNAVVFNSTSNMTQRSTCGIATCGERMASEVRTFLASHPCRASINQISFFSYSAGGLWSHFAATSLYKSGLFDQIKPLFFITVATPYLGIVYQPSHTSHLWLFRQFINCGSGNFAGCLGGRTVEELVLGDDEQEPLLLKMSRSDNDFGQCFDMFAERISLGNTRNDFTVPFESSMMTKYNPYAIGELQHKTSEDRFELHFQKHFQEGGQDGARATSKRTCYSCVCELFMSILFLVVVCGLWLPVISTLTLGFLVPITASLLTRWCCFDKASDRRNKGYCCFGHFCCGIDSMFPCLCFRRACSGKSTHDIWMKMYENRKLQKIKVIPVSIHSGNAHGKIVNRPCCCSENRWKEGREVAMKVVERMKKKP